MSGDAKARTAPSFSEKGFYLGEFRGRSIAVAVPEGELAAAPAIAPALAELEANGTRVLLLSDARAGLEALLGAGAIDADAPRLAAAVWRAFAQRARAGIAAAGARSFPATCREIALCLGISKLVWIDREGGLLREDGKRLSFVHAAELNARLARAGDPTPPRRREVLREIAAMLAGGLPAVNLCSAEGFADELFTYAGSGTYFSRENYVEVRRLTLDDFDAAADLIGRGIAEGYLLPRSPEEIERVLVHAFGAFVEGRHLAGIGALLLWEEDRAGEIASLYTLTRFLGEGIGGDLIRHAAERARSRGCRYLFACTTTERVVGFFEAQGFRRVPPDRIPTAKWRGYDEARRDRVRCLRRDLD